ncbi:MAG: hypothetical protein CHACPFDD_03664 [Phycisphaerae bacterium]|nr:hypothetical protein [Phycisphaerae bacterium]
MRTHVAILRPALLKLVLSGRKQLESRLYRTRRTPVGRVRVGDTIYLKPTGGAVEAVCRAGAVRELPQLRDADLRRIRARYQTLLQAPRNYWRRTRKSRCGVLIWLADVRRCGPVVEVPRQFGSGWVELPVR